MKCPDYDRANVERSLAEALEPFGGMASFVRSGADVLLKPNLISPRPIDACATTHPEVVAATARAVIATGGRPRIGESPGIGSFQQVTKATGIASVASELEIPLFEFIDAADAPRPQAARFKKLAIAQDVLDAETLINLPKVKTHQQMVLTLAVKNLFGCVAGRQKIAWHMNAGRDAALFARMLVEVCAAARPTLNIADGIWGMEGKGPTHGEPRFFGFIAASDDAFALDAVIAHALGFRQEDVPIFAAAKRAERDGLPTGVIDLHNIQIAGCSIEDLRIGRVKPPAAGRLMFVPPVLAGLARRLITVRPKITPACKLCGVCTSHCPAEAMAIVDGRVEIDDTLCIRCFCCQELCPHGAVDVARGLLSRLFAR